MAQMKTSVEVSNFSAGEKQVHNWSPYDDNGGSIVSIGGNGYVVIASDTRLSTGFKIYTRDQPKLFKLTNGTVLGSTGCWCDILTFTRVIEARIKMYKYEHNRVPSTAATAQLISNMLYFRRFFPYYISNIVVGIDESGQGVVYSYDPIGHMEKHTYRASGSSCSLLQPLLDNQVGLKNLEIVEGSRRSGLSKEAALQLVKDVFISAAERDIYCGDGVFINIITKDGVEEERFPLRQD